MPAVSPQARAQRRVQQRQLAMQARRRRGARQYNPAGPVGTRRQSIRVLPTPEEHEALRAYADQRRVSLSRAIRSALQQVGILP
jgi:hypothetical protein